MSTAAELAMPRSAQLQAMLRTTTERLAQELASPEAQAPAWTALQWRVAMAAAVMHGASALLAGRLRWHGPPAWQAFLDGQQLQGRLRQARTQDLLRAIDAAARRAQLPLVALKGSALLDLALHAPGERPMSDIDLLCAPPHFEAAGRLVEGLGYRAGAAHRRHREYQPLDSAAGRVFGEHIDNPVKIELHGHIAERLPLREVDITAQIFPTTARPGLNPYPSLPALMQHLLLHAAGNLCARGLRLIQLHDIALLADRLNNEDWDGADAGWALPPLALVERYFPGRVPAAVLGRAAARCPPVLRWAARRWRLADVSLSHLGTPMLPGIEWSASAGEAFAWARTRLHPGRDAIAATRQAALAQHALAGAAWARQARWRKLLRVLAGRAPRSATVYSVQAALDYRPAPASSAYSASTRAAV